MSYQAFKEYIFSVTPESTHRFFDDVLKDIITADTAGSLSFLADIAIWSSGRIPYWAKPFVYAFKTYMINRYDKTAKDKLFEERDKLKDVAETEKQKKEENPLIPIQPQLEQSSKESFQGFEEGNVCLFGVTQSGKTTAFITWLYTDLIKDFDLFILIGSDLLKADKVQEIRTAVQYALKAQGLEYNENCFAFYNRTQLDDGIDFATTNSGRKKLVFFDDIQLDTSSKNFEKVALFTQECKHANCRVFTSMHMTFNDKGAEIIRSSAKYFCLFNQHEQNFNRLLNLEKGNRLWRKYNLIPDLHDRVIIHDIVQRKNFFGTYPYSRMDPLINSEGTNDMPAFQSTQTKI